MQLDEQIFKLSANIRYVYVLGNVLVTYNLMLIALGYVSSTVPWTRQQSPRRLKYLMLAQTAGIMVLTLAVVIMGNKWL